jgi:hypothetical protein
MPDIEAGELTPIVQVNYRQVIMPYHGGGSFLGNDVNYHDFRFPARGKSIIGFFIDNPANKDLTWELYGSHTADGLPDEAGVKKIANDTVATVTAEDGTLYYYAYPFYVLRCYFSEAPTDNPVKTVSVWIDLQALVPIG